MGHSTQGPMKILVIDVGGTHVKLLASGRRTPLKLPSGPDLTPRDMVRAVREATATWHYDAVTIGYPGPVKDNKPAADPINLGKGWVRYDFKKAFKKPVKIMNDAAMQAIGSYDGGNMLFLGLGTGLGTALVRDGAIIPLEIAHLPYCKGRSYEEYVGAAALKKFGPKKWRHHVEEVVGLFRAALTADYVVLGGGNARLMEVLPPHTRLGSNLNAFRGGYRIWKTR